LEWSGEAEEFLESRREKLPGSAIDVDQAISRIRRDSEKLAAAEGVEVVRVEHVKSAIMEPPKEPDAIEKLPRPLRGIVFILTGLGGFLPLSLFVWLSWRPIWRISWSGREFENLGILVVYVLFVVVAFIVLVELVWNGWSEMKEVTRSFRERF
jgi:hypothetical protein